jgi:hypothetical protein
MKNVNNTNCVCSGYWPVESCFECGDEPSGSGATELLSYKLWSPAGAKDFSSSLCVQTGSGAHPASCTMGTGGPFPGGKARPRRDADHSPLFSAEVVNE